MSKRIKTKRSWRYDVCSNMKIELMDWESGMANSGDYYHTTFHGDFKTARGAWIRGRSELLARLRIAQANLEEFDSSYRAIAKAERE